MRLGTCPTLPLRTGRKFCLPTQMQPVRPEPSTPTPYDTTYAKSSHPSPVIASTSRVFILLLITSSGPEPSRNNRRVAHRFIGDRSNVEGVYQSWPPRLGRHHPDLQYVCVV